MKVTRFICLTMLALLVCAGSTQAGTIRYTLSSDESAETRDSSTACDSCDSGCDAVCGTSCSEQDWTISLFAPSDHCFDDFISPMTNPIFFEDPRTLSEARFIYLHHKLPIGIAGGGDVDLLALQLRAALTERLSLIATKDGFIMSDNPLFTNDGWADISVGLKYNLMRDPVSGIIISGGATYEAPFGSPSALQGNGDGLFNLFLSGGARIGERGHWISTAGQTLAVDSAAESEFMYWSNHFDRRIGDSIVYGFTEFNWFNYTSSGAGGVPGVEGGDLFNLGSTGVTGNDIVTGALGIKLKPSRHSEVGIAWEVPLTERRDVLDNRLTFDFILRY